MVLSNLKVRRLRIGEAKRLSYCCIEAETGWKSSVVCSELLGGTTQRIWGKYKVSRIYIFSFQSSELSWRMWSYLQMARIKSTYVSEVCVTEHFLMWDPSTISFFLFKFCLGSSLLTWEAVGLCQLNHIRPLNFPQKHIPIPIAFLYKPE